MLVEQIKHSEDNMNFAWPLARFQSIALHPQRCLLGMYSMPYANKTYPFVLFLAHEGCRVTLLHCFLDLELVFNKLIGVRIVFNVSLITHVFFVRLPVILIFRSVLAFLI